MSEATQNSQRPKSGRSKFEGIKNFHAKVKFFVILKFFTWLNLAIVFGFIRGTSQMPLQNFLPELKGLVKKSIDLDLILKIRYPFYCPAILVEVDTLDSTDN
jgi:hypothetical protein